MKLVRYDKDVMQIVNDNEVIIGSLLRLANNKWGVFDKNEVRMSKAQFEDKTAAFDLFKKLVA